VAGDLLALLEQEFDRVIRALKAVVPGHGVEERTAHRPPSTPGMAGR
jgi:hypothetical protein